jgi:hypothetical protein
LGVEPKISKSNKFKKFVKKMNNLLDFLNRIGDNTVTSLVEMATRPQVSSEPGFFFAHRKLETK